MIAYALFKAVLGFLLLCLWCCLAVLVAVSAGVVLVVVGGARWVLLAHERRHERSR